MPTAPSKPISCDYLYAGLLSIISFLTVIVNAYFGSPNSTLTTILNVLLFTTTILLCLLGVISGFDAFKQRLTSTSINELDRTKSRANLPDIVGTELDTLSNSIGSISATLEDLKSRIENYDALTAIVSDDDKIALIQLVKDEILAAGADDASKKIIEQITSERADSELLAMVHHDFENAITRLEKDSKASESRGIMNLYVGIIAACAGALALALPAFFLPSTIDDDFSFFRYFLPKLSVGIVIEIFAYFFLKLYKSNLSEIKYYQNEITNIESKRIALTSSLGLTDSSPASSIIKVLSETDRNAILEKGQTTVEIEKARAEQHTFTSMSDNLAKIFNATK